MSCCTTKETGHHVRKYRNNSAVSYRIASLRNSWQPHKFRADADTSHPPPAQPRPPQGRMQSAEGFFVVASLPTTETILPPGQRGCTMMMTMCWWWGGWLCIFLFTILQTINGLHVPLCESALELPWKCMLPFCTLQSPRRFCHLNVASRMFRFIRQEDHKLVLKWGNHHIMRHQQGPNNSTNTRKRTKETLCGRDTK